LLLLLLLLLLLKCCTPCVAAGHIGASCSPRNLLPVPAEKKDIQSQKPYDSSWVLSCWFQWCCSFTCMYSHDNAACLLCYAIAAAAARLLPPASLASTTAHPSLCSALLHARDCCFESVQHTPSTALVRPAADGAASCSKQHALIMCRPACRRHARESTAVSGLHVAAAASTISSFHTRQFPCKC
jgi:hypothetical protein